MLKTYFILLLLGLSVVSAQGQLNIHGHLSQGYAITNGSQIFGIDEEGTWDYRNLALQFRYDAGEDYSFLIQLNHKRLGESPIMTLRRDVELDWGFFEYRFNNRHRLKIGKIQLPLGIYNEWRDVGVLLPFYQVPFVPYHEGNYSSETIDGLVWHSDFDITDNWGLETNAFLGRWNWQETTIFQDPLSGNIVALVSEPEFRNAFGAQVWLNLPGDGLRVGMSGYRGKVFGGAYFNDTPGGIGEEDMMVMLTSLDASFDKFYLRSESTYYRFSQNDFSAFGYYFQSGYQFPVGLQLNMQYGYYDIYDLIGPVVNTRFDLKYYRDYAIGVNFRFNPTIILKIENHWNEGLVADAPVFLGGRFINKNIRYTIVSLSTSF